MTITALRTKRDWRFALALLIGLACSSFGASYFRASQLDPVIFSYGDEGGYRRSTSDVWFDGDIPKTFLIMTNHRATQHKVATEHPLISLTLYPPVRMLRAAGLDGLEATRIIVAGASALWVAAMFTLLLLMGCRLLDATLFALLGMVSASVVFWFAVPEAFAIGSITLLVVLCVAALDGKQSLFLHGLLNALALSQTITNWMAGWLASGLKLGWRNTWKAAAIGASIVSALWCLQKLFFPYSSFVGSSRPLQFLYAPTLERVTTVLASFFLHSMVMPEPTVIERNEFQHVLSVQHSSMLSGGLVRVIAVGAWVALLTLGAAIFVERRRELPTAWKLLGLLLSGQLALHLVFGGETFLYSMHFLPLLIAGAAMVTTTHYRDLARALAAIVVIAGGLYNWLQFAKAAEYVRVLGALVDSSMR